MALVPPQSKEDWLYATIYSLAQGQEVMMATLSELLQGSRDTQAKMASLLQREEGQSAALTGLAGSVDTLIDLVEELKSGLSAEEQAVADEAMTAIAQTLSQADAALQRSGQQSTVISGVAAKAQAASGPATPTP